MVQLASLRTVPGIGKVQMFSVSGWTTCCGSPTRKEVEYHLFVYVNREGNAFVYLRHMNTGECDPDGKSERRIVPEQVGNPTSGPQPVSAHILGAPYEG